MTAYFWTKAHPGLYYLYDQPRSPFVGGRVPIGKVKKTGLAYRVTWMAEQFAGTYLSHRKAIAALEEYVQKPGDTFTREGF